MKLFLFEIMVCLLITLMLISAVQQEVSEQCIR